MLWVLWYKGGVIYLLWQRLFQGGQGSVCVTGVGLQRLDPVLEVPQLLVFVPQLLLQVLNLTQKNKKEQGAKHTIKSTISKPAQHLKSVYLPFFKSLKLNTLQKQHCVQCEKKYIKNYKTFKFWKAELNVNLNIYQTAIWAVQDWPELRYFIYDKTGKNNDS